MNANTIPKIPVMLNFSLNTKTPIKIVASNPITDHIVPTTES